MKWRNTCILWNNTMCHRQEYLAHCFPMRIELPFERNIAYHSFFSIVRNITFVQNNSFQVKWISTASLVKQPSMLEAGESSTLFPYVNWVNFSKEYWLPLRVFKCEGHYLCVKWLHSSERKKHCISSKRSFMSEAWGSSTLFPYENWVNFWKE
jgi:hypothetical protein